MVYSPYKKGGKANASILYEMPHQEGAEGCQSYNHEERKAGDSGGMSHVWHQDVQNRKKLRLILKLNQTGSRDSFSVLFLASITLFKLLLPLNILIGLTYFHGREGYIRVLLNFLQPLVA